MAIVGQSYNHATVRVQAVRCSVGCGLWKIKGPKFHGLALFHKDVG